MSHLGIAPHPVATPRAPSSADRPPPTHFRQREQDAREAEQRAVRQLVGKEPTRQRHSSRPASPPRQSARLWVALTRLLGEFELLRTPRGCGAAVSACQGRLEAPRLPTPNTQVRRGRTIEQLAMLFGAIALATASAAAARPGAASTVAGALPASVASGARRALGGVFTLVLGGAAQLASVGGAAVQRASGAPVA